MYEMVTEAICPLLCKLPARYARVQGSSEYPQIEGMIFFHRFREGTIVVADIMGLPETESGILVFIFMKEGLAAERKRTPLQIPVDTLILMKSRILSMQAT